MKPVQIIVYVNAYSLSHNARMGWRARKRLDDEAKREAHLGWLLAGSPRYSGRVRVSVVRHGSRLVDPFNLLDGLKAVVDGLFTARGCGIVPDDSPRYLELGTVTQAKCKRGDECCIFTIAELPP